MNWLFETGRSKRRGSGETWKEAIRDAWSKRPPKTIGVLVMMTPDDGTPTRYVAGEVALQIAGTRAWEDADNLINEAWATIWLPDKDAAAYRAALEKVDKANVLEPNDPSILNTLGAAQYRTGSHEDALKTLAKAQRVSSDVGDVPNQWNLAFETMALHKLGRAEEAKAALARFREMCKDEHLGYDVELQGLLAEAEGLIEGKNP